MAKKPLNPTQAALMEAVRTTSDKRTAERSLIRRRHELAIQEELAALDLALALSVRRAYEGGISVARIGTDGLGSSDWATANGWLKRTDRLAAVEAEAQGHMPFTWLDSRLVAVYLPNFDTAAPPSDDYPDVLMGTVERSSTSRTGWRVVTDPGEQSTPTGTLPGWLTWEIERPASADRSLVAALNEWAGVQ